VTTTISETATAAARPGGCRYPGCGNQARVKDPAAPGPRPGYCGQEVAEDRGDGTMVLVRHTAMTAFRRREQLAGQPASDRPVTAAVSRAAAVRDDALAAVTRLAGQLTAALDQLAAIGEQLTAAADPQAAEAQIEAARAEAAAGIEQARAEAAGHAGARHAAELDAAEARAAAAEALAALEEQARARQQAGAGLAAARAEAARAHRERDDAAAAASAARDHDARQHAAGLAAVTTRLDAAGDTITALRDQTTRAEQALDRERAGHHRTVTLLHDLLTHAGSEQPRHEPQAAHGNSTSRRRPPAAATSERTHP
jgi:hypothetical protein